MDSKRKTVFLVDDDMTNLRVGKNALSGSYNVFTLDSGEAMLEMLENVRPDLILLDVSMPGMDGHEAIRRLKADRNLAGIPVVFLTALNDEEMELKGLSMGAIDYIAKPFSPPLLLKRIEVHLLVAAQKQELLFFNNNLTRMVEEKTATVVELKNAIISTMAELVEFRDEITGGHIVRTQRYIRSLLGAMEGGGVYVDEISSMDWDLIIQSSQLHDVGKIAITDAILNKPDRLTAEEFAVMKTHAEIGGKIISRLKEKAIDSDFLEYAKIIAVSHHEKWDGSGYPAGLSGVAIPILGRLMAIADVYDALRESRPYKNGFPHGEAVSIILDGSGRHFDPALVNLFADIQGDFAGIAEEEGI